MNKDLLDYFNNDELAANVWLSKYAQEGDKTPDDMHKRMAARFASVEERYDNSSHYNRLVLSYHGRTRDKLTYERIYKLFKDFKYIIPQGSVMSQLGSTSIGSLSNCFVIGQPEDSYGGIMLKDEEQVQLMKRRGGVGIDLSTLRPAGTPTSNAAKTSTGAVSFMHRFSESTREVAQNGRRGALMISIAERHPDVFDFVKIKRDLTKVTGANISIKLYNDFMQAVVEDKDFILRFPVDTKLNDEDFKDLPYNEVHTVGDTKVKVKKIRAKELWDEVIKSARDVAEPGLMFWDNMIDYSPDGVYPEYRAVTTNPCSEIAMQPYDACRLIAVNLFSFVDNPFTSSASFNYTKFFRVNYDAMRLSDDLIDLELEHIEKILTKNRMDPESSEAKEVEKRLWERIKETAASSRRTGLGFTALGDTLAALGMRYDSNKALEVIENIMKIKLASELNCTIDLAIERGTFKGFDGDKEFSFDSDGKVSGNNGFFSFIADNYPLLAEKMYKYGRRNVSWSTVAPTGSLSLLAQVTSGIEPLFMPFYTRRKKVNPDDKDVRVDFTDQNGDTWQEFTVLHPKFKDWILKTPDYTEQVEAGVISSVDDLNSATVQSLFVQSPWYKATANDIDWSRRVEIQGIIQKYISHSISSTINLPETVSYEEVSDIYMKSWKYGLKGITVYRDGSRSGVMVSNDKKEDTSFEYVDAVKRPKELPANCHTTVVKGKKFNVLVGLLDDKPYEVFIADHFTNEDSFLLVKKGRGRYDLIKDGETYSEDITAEMSDEQVAITRLASTSLRHGADIKFIVEQLQKADGDLFSFTKGLARILKKYIPDGAKSTVKCNDCGSDNVIFEEGCHKCLDCGSSACS